MDRRPHLVAPVLLLGIVLTVTGGIATGFSERDRPDAPAAGALEPQESTTGTGGVEASGVEPLAPGGESVPVQVGDPRIPRTDRAGGAAGR